MKKQHYFLFWTWLFAFALSLPLHAQTQIGQDIDGEREDDKSGTSVSLSADGTILAIGAIYNRVGGDEGGHVRVYQWNGTTWMKLGADIDGMDDERYGTSVSLSANGKILAIGAPNYGGFRTGKGGVRVHQWDASTLAWVRLGADIEGEAADDDFGTSVSLSANGTKLAIGAFKNDGNGGDAGHVRVYQWNGTAMAWEQQGGDIDGEATGDASGCSVSLSADGTKLAIGAYSNDDNGNRAGHVRVYQWNSTTMAWQQQGLDIDGEAANDNFGRSVSLSADGTRLAIGSADADYVQVYQWNGTAWEQQGTDINGSNGFGSAVSLSAGGTRLAIGAYYESSPTGASQAGQVQVYQWNGTAWAQQEVDIYGEAAYDHSGTSVSLSADGSRVAIGAPDNDGSGDDAGHVRVYEACPRVATTTETMTWNGSSNTDWNTPCNWSPNGVPTATNPVLIPDVTNDPVVPTNLAAVAKSILFQDGNHTLTVQSNATLTVTGTVVNLVSVTITNSGTITTAGFRSENNTPPFVQTLTFLNQSTGVVNGSFFTSGGSGGSQGAIRLTNHGNINYSGSDKAIFLSHYSSTFNNYGTINITGGLGIDISVDGGVNHACGKILMSAGEFYHSRPNDFTNHGLVQIAGNLYILYNERFVNHGVVKYGRLTRGGIKNTEGIIVHDTVPIFTYGSASQDTVKGIYTDADATLSAGTFTAPNTFMPLASLPAGSQTLYAKITPSGGTCSFVVPFTYNNVAKKLFVKADATGANNGASWTDAFTNLQSTLAIAITGDEIWVAKGTYKPTADGSGNTTPTDPRDKTFVMKDGVKLYGSFAGTETTLAERTPAVMAANPAILSGDFGDNDVVAGSGSTLSITGNGENAYHVVVVAFINNTPTTYLDGFTITGGNANGSDRMTINGLNVSRILGGGIHINGGPTTVTNNTITGNSATYGGGIYTASGTTVSNNTIIRNSANEGGGISTTSGTTTVTNNTITGNSAAAFGGGISTSSGTTTVTNNTITGNSAADGGGISTFSSSGTTTATNNTITGNSAADYGGGISAHGGNNRLTNNTIIGNSAGVRGGGIYTDHFRSGISTITNSIIWANSGGVESQISAINQTFVTYSIVQGGYTGTGNKNQDPLFVNAADIDGADNIHRTADDGLLLLACSPAVNAGNNEGIPSGITSDITGMDRFFNTTVDMGAYELRANPSVVPTITLGTIPTICAGATSFTIPYTATTGTPTTYSISGTGITAVTDATLPTGAITVNLSAAASGTAIPFTLTVKNASGCASAEITGSVTVNSNTTPSVSIDPTAICAGTGTMLTATATNGGSSPQFYWTKNNTPQGTLTFSNKSTADGLGSNQAYNVYVDKNGTVYAAMNNLGGLGISTDGGASFITKTPANSGLGSPDIRKVFVDKNGTLYVATEGGGLSISTDGGTSFMNRTVANSGLADNGTYSVFVDKNGTIYVGTGAGLSISTNGGASFTTANGLGDNFIFDIYVDDAGKIYAANTNRGLSISSNGGTSFTNRNAFNSGLLSDNLNSVFVDNAGTIYVATASGLSISTNGGTSFINKTPTNSGLGSTRVSDVFVDNAGIIYAATHALGGHLGGLSISTDGGASFINKTTADGLGNNRLFSVFVDKAGKIYIGMNGNPTVGDFGVSIGSSLATGNTVAVSNAVAGDVYKVRLVPSADACPSPATATASVTVSANTTITSVSLTQPTCAVPTGTAIVRTLNSNTLEFSKDNMNWQADSTFSGLPPGNYTFYARRTASPTCVGSSAQTINPVPACSRVIYVNAANTNPTQNGTSWSTAFSQLTAGLSAAAAVSGVSVEVWVAQGTYKPGSLRRDVFTIPSGIKVYGGFVGNEDQLTLRDWKNRKTILSGEIGSAQRSDNTYHVVSFSATNDQTQLDGFHIEKAFGDFFTGNQSAILDAPNFQQSGGGILAINKSKGAVSNCVITDNKATFGGGILLRDSSQLLIAQTVIWGNEATFGGGVYVLGGSKPRFENTLIVANKGLGGGFYVNASQPTLIHCTLASNLGTNGTAGGIFNSNATTTLKNSILWGNSAPQSTNGSLITYSIIEGGFAGTGNRNANPRFVSASPGNLAMMTALGDYHLLNCSPAIDAANNPDGLSQDLDGNTRPFPSAVGIADMGAYESSGSNGSGPATLTLTAPITSGTVLQAAGQITATNQVSGATVIYQGSQSVTLLPGFSAIGNSFQALIGDCQTAAVTGSEAQK